MEQKTTKTTTKPTKASAAKAPAKKNTGLIIGVIVAVVVVIVAIVAIVAAVNSGKGDAGEAGSSLDDGKIATKTVGSDEYGYVVVPENWEEISSAEGFQYGDSGSGYYVSILVEDASELTAEDWAQGVELILEQGGAGDVESTTEKLGDLGDANVVTGYYDTYSRWLKAYTIESGDKVYYIAVEGPEKDNAAFEVPSTFKLEK